MLREHHTSEGGLLWRRGVTTQVLLWGARGAGSPRGWRGQIIPWALQRGRDVLSNNCLH